MATTEARQAVQVFVRDGCHLCDNLLLALENYRRRHAGRIGFDIEVCDIEDRADWLAHFSDHVPVVVVNGQEVCHYFLDSEELEQALQCH